MTMKLLTRTARTRRLLPSFTLVELLIAITIIGIMLGMVLYTLAGARRDAMTARTQGTIKKLNDIILARWEEFRYRSVKINVPEDWLVPVNMGVGISTAPLSPREGARLRMVVLRDVMRMEFPDRYSDILYTPAFYKVATWTSDNGPPLSNTSNDSPEVIERTVPALYKNFRKKMVKAAATPVILGQYPATAPVVSQGTLIPTLDYQQVELLYQIVASTNLNGSNGLEFFRPSEIDDKDGDGFPEFIDAWGNPIFWLRWPAGYGVVQPPASAPMTPDEIAKSRPVDSMVNDRTIPDPMDPLRTDWRWSHPAFANASKPWMLVPLIVSAGPDGVFDIKFEYSTPVNYATHIWDRGGTGSAAHSTGFPYSFPDPYYNYYHPSSNPVVEGLGGIGEWQDDDGDKNTFGAQDNITNYSLILE